MVSPVNLPSYHTGMTLPPITGRWLSRNKDTVQLINTKPAFIYPQVPLLDEEKKEPSADQQNAEVGATEYVSRDDLSSYTHVTRADRHTDTQTDRQTDR